MDFDLIPPGTYKARAVATKEGKSQKGTAWVAVTFQILEGHHAGQEVVWYGTLTEKTQEWTVKALQTCGWSMTDDTLDTVTTNEVEIRIKHEEYEGKHQAKVAYVNPIGRLNLQNKMSPDETRTFMARLKAVAMMVADKSGTPLPPRVAPPVRPPLARATGKAATTEARWEPKQNEDDLPF